MQNARWLLPSFKGLRALTDLRISLAASATLRAVPARVPHAKRERATKPTQTLPFTCTNLNAASTASFKPAMFHGSEHPNGRYRRLSAPLNRARQNFAIDLVTAF